MLNNNGLHIIVMGYIKLLLVRFFNNLTHLFLINSVIKIK